MLGPLTGLSLSLYLVVALFHNNLSVPNTHNLPCTRALFIIDGLGTLRQVTINDSGVGRSVDEVLRLVKAIQFYDSYGEGA